jgi:hypothetical protein
MLEYSSTGGSLERSTLREATSSMAEYVTME